MINIEWIYYGMWEPEPHPQGGYSVTLCVHYECGHAMGQFAVHVPTAKTPASAKSLVSRYPYRYVPEGARTCTLCASGKENKQ